MIVFSRTTPFFPSVRKMRARTSQRKSIDVPAALHVPELCRRPSVRPSTFVCWRPIDVFAKSARPSGVSSRTLWKKRNICGKPPPLSAVVAGSKPLWTRNAILRFEHENDSSSDVFKAFGRPVFRCVSPRINDRRNTSEWIWKRSLRNHAGPSP